MNRSEDFKLKLKLNVETISGGSNKYLGLTVARIANKVTLCPNAIGFLIISSSYSGVSNTLHHNMFRILQHSQSRIDLILFVAICADEENHGKTPNMQLGLER